MSTSSTAASPSATPTRGRVVVCGAGPVGALAAVALGKRGFDVTVYESREDIRTQPNYTGRSINLALSARGLEGLALAGLDGEWRERGIPMYARFIHNIDGTSAQQPYGPNGEAILSVSRKLVNERLIEVASALPNVHFVHNAPVAFVDPRRRAIRFRTVAEMPDDVGADLIVGADGFNSRVREAIGYGNRFDFSQTFIEHGYKELSMPPVAGAEGEARWALPKNFLHIWPRGSFMLIALPNADGSFTCTLFMPFVCGGHGFDELDTDDKVKAFMTTTFPDAVPLMGDWLGDWHRNLVGNLGTIRCGTYHLDDRLVLVGDAAHAMCPFFGQGMNAGMQDVTTLMRLVDSHDWTSQRALILSQYSALQVPAGHAMCDLALQNYSHMREHAASPLWRLQKAIENALHRWLGDAFIPEYTMVSFRTIPYDEVVRREARQQRILKRTANALVLGTVVTAGYLVWRFAGARIRAFAAPAVARLPQLQLSWGSQK